jgi:hypothetical protein
MISVKWPSGARGWLLRPVSPRPSILILVPHRKRLSGQRRASQAIFPGMVPSGRHTATGGRRTTSESSRRRPSRDDFCQVAFWRTRLASEAGISATQYSDTRATPKAALRPTSCVSGHISWHGPQRQAHSNRRPPDDEREQSAKTVRDDFCQVAFWRTRLASEAGISATQYSDTRATPKAALRPTSCVSGHISWHGPQRQAHSNRRPPDDEREQSAKTVPR